MDTLREDTGCKSTDEIANCMEDRTVRRKIVSLCTDKSIDR